MFNRKLYNESIKLNSKIKDLIANLSEEKFYDMNKIIPVKLPVKNKMVWEVAHNNENLFIDPINSFIFKINRDVKGWDGHMILSCTEKEYSLKFINAIDLNKWKYKELFHGFIFEEIKIFKNFINLLIK